MLADSKVVFVVLVEQRMPCRGRPIKPEVGVGTGAGAQIPREVRLRPSPEGCPEGARMQLHPTRGEKFVLPRPSRG